MLGAGTAMGGDGAWHPLPWAHRWPWAVSQQPCLLTKAKVAGVALPECWQSGWYWGHPQVSLGRGEA